MTSHRWTPALDDAILAHRNGGMSVRRSATLLGLTEGMVGGRLQRLLARDGVSIPIDTSAFNDAAAVLADYDGTGERLGMPGPLKAEREAVARANELTDADRVWVDRERDYTFAPLDLGSQTVERILLIPDTHAPYHDRFAWRAMLAFARAWRPHTIIHLGDWADAYAISAHDKDPHRKQQLADEMKVVRETREEVDDLGAARKIITLGNHDAWLTRQLARLMPGLVDSLNIDGQIGLTENGWSVVPYKSHARVGKLNVTHECGYSGQNATTQTGNAFGKSVAFGHTHRLATQFFGEITGERHVAMNCGWLGNLGSAEYATAPQKRLWSHGFGTVEMLRSGNFQPSVIPIVDRRVILHGAVCS